MLGGFSQSRSHGAPQEGGERMPSRPPAARTMVDRGPASYKLLEKVIERLAEVVERETVALRGHVAIDLKEFNDKKSQGLHELNHALRPFADGALEGPVLLRLADLGKKLEANRAILKLHMDAAREIATLVADAIRELESDGTYSASLQHNGW
jgi:hypothetical protein